MYFFNGKFYYSFDFSIVAYVFTIFCYFFVDDEFFFKYMSGILFFCFNFMMMFDDVLFMLN